MWTPFFGRLASTSPLPALLCKRTGAALMTASLFTKEPGQWRMTITQPCDQPNDSVESLTAKINATIADGNPARAGGLVLGPQSLENPAPKLAPEQIQTRALPAAESRAGRAETVSRSDSRQQLAGR
jgi:hypothetical protein